MSIEVSKKTTRAEVDKALSLMKNKSKQMNIEKYFGKINFGADGLTFQKKVRNEWN